MSLWGEFKRRNVFKVLTAYAAFAWLTAEVTSTIAPPLGLPEWIPSFVVVLLLLGFPVALFLAWAYEVTPDGIKRTEDIGPTESIRHVTGQRLNYVIIAFLLLALAAVTIDNYVLEERDPGVTNRRSIAVLPLANLSPDPADESFADGIHGELLTQLAKIGSLKVISRTSVLGSRDSPKNMREIGRELGVAAILEGDVQRSGDTVRINVQLIDAEADDHLWAEVYEQRLTTENLFAIQTETANAIAAALRAKLTPQEAAQLSEVPTQSTRAYDFYLSGRDYDGDGYRAAGLELAVQQYTRAVDEDPEFALAWSRLSIAQTHMYWFAVERTEARLQSALTAARRALSLRPDLAEAHLAMAWHHFQGHRNYDEALRELAIAADQMSGSAELHFARASIYRQRGRWDDAVAGMERALELDPRNVDILMQYQLILTALRNYAGATVVLDRALEIAPDYRPAQVAKAEISLYRDGNWSPLELVLPNDAELAWQIAIWQGDYAAALRHLDRIPVDVLSGQGYFRPKAALYGLTYKLTGRAEQAIHELEAARGHVDRALQADPEDPRLMVALAEVLAGLGDAEEATRLGYRIMEMRPRSFDAIAGPIYQLAAVERIFIPAGNVDSAISTLDAYLGGPGYYSLEGLLATLDLRAFRDDPRFVALVEKYKRP